SPAWGASIGNSIKRAADREGSLAQSSVLEVPPAPRRIFTTMRPRWRHMSELRQRRRDALIFEDNDESGRTKALDAAHALLGTAKTIRIVGLRDSPEKGDVSDWLDADTRNAGKFADVCFDTPLWTSDSPPPSSAPAITLQWIDMSNWGREPIPERQWIIRDRV